LNYWKISFGCLAGLVLAVASCGHPGGGGGGTGGSTGSGGSGNCTPGTLGCACNGTSCNAGLSCATDLGQGQCVSTGSGSGGTTGSSGGATGSSGGATGSGGGVSSGGNTGTGGSATGGAAGDGSTGSGGAVSTGGTPGTGGAAGGGAAGAGGSATGGNTGSGGTGPANNLIVNGDFSQGTTNWHFENGTASVNNGQYCATSISSGALFGWQNMTTPLMLSGSHSYTLSYQASGSNNAAIHVKVAHADSPYTPDDYDPMNNNQTVNDMLSTSLQTFTHMFTPGMGDDSDTGVAFFVEAGQNVCIANVILVQD
jgi:hypothetical protein